MFKAKSISEVVENFFEKEKWNSYVECLSDSISKLSVYVDISENDKLIKEKLKHSLDDLIEYVVDTYGDRPY